MLTITKAELTITANDQSYVYNGSAQGEDNATYTDDSKVTVEGLQGSDALTSITLDGQERNVGEYAGKIVASAAEIGENTGNYDITYVAGMLTITKAELTITVNDQTYTYNATPQGEDNATYTDDSKVTVEGLQGTDELTSITLDGQETNAGEYTGKIVASAADIGENTGNYDITYVAGKLKIEQAKLTITVKDQSYPYNGMQQGEVDPVYNDPADIATKVKVEGLQGDDAITSIILTGSRTDVGSTDIELTGLQIGQDGLQTPNYDITRVKGTLTITQKTLTITVIDQTYTYNTSPQGEDNNTYTADADISARVRVEGLEGDDKLASITLNGQETNAGEYAERIVPSAPEITVLREGSPEDGTLNYGIVYVAGKLTINKAPATELGLSVTGYSGTYDANTHEGSATTTVTEGTTITYSTDGGTTWSTTKPSIKDVDSIDFMARAENPNYVTAEANGNLTVTAAAAIVTADNATKVYGEDDPKFTAKVSGVIDDYELSYNVTRPRVTIDENVGIYEDAIVPSGAEIQGNYTVSYVPADFIITKAGTLIVVPTGYEGMYDGQAHEGSATASVMAGTTLEYSLDGTNWSTTAPSITNVGSLTFQVRATNPNYETVTASADLVVTPRTIVMTSATVEKPYDGTELTRDAQDDITVTGDGFVSGEGATYDITGTQTLVGSSDNTFTYLLNEGTLEDNYIITTEFGTLTVTGDKIDGEKTTPEVSSNYELGDAIPFTITVENNSDAAVETTVTDPQTTIVSGDGYTASGNTATMTVPAGGSVVVYAEHIVTQEDILAGTFENTATIGWDDQNTHVTKDVTATTDFIDPIDGTITVTKERTNEPANGIGYVVGEAITYSITVENTGNVDYPNVHVADDLTGDYWDIPLLAVGDKVVFEAEYTVTDADMNSDTISNTATAIGDPIEDPSNPGRPVVPEGSDTVDDTPIFNTLDGAFYQLTVNYIAEGRQFDQYTGTYRTGEEYNVTSPKRTGFTPDQRIVTGTITEDTVIDVIYTRNSYNITVTYRDPYGNIVAQQTTRRLKYGDTYTIYVPTVNGFVPQQTVVTGTVPARDVQITVFYTPVPTEEEPDNTVVINDYDTALGLGNVSLNAGDCFE